MVQRERERERERDSDLEVLPYIFSFFAHRYFSRYSGSPKAYGCV
jgi:hypothetical protein